MNVSVKKSYADFFAVCLFLNCLFSVFSISCHLPSLVSSVSFYASFVIIFTWLVFDIIFAEKLIPFWTDDWKIIYKKFAFFLLASGILVYVFSFLHSFESVSDLKLSYFRKPVITIGCFVCLYLGVFNSFSRITKKAFLLIANLTTIVLALSFCIFKNGRFWNGDYLVLNFENPNATGLLLGILFCCELISFFHAKKGLQKITTLVLAVFCLVCVFMTKSRNSILSVSLFVILFLLLKFLKFKNKGIVFSYLVTFLPIFVLLIYIALFSNDTINFYLSNLTVFSGKSLGTRTLDWFTGYRIFGKSMLFGNFKLSADSSSYLSGYLNSYLDWLVEGGLCSFFFFVALIFLSLFFKSRSFSPHNSVLLIAFSAFSFLFYSSTFESGFFFGLHGYFVFPIFCSMFCPCDPNAGFSIDPFVKDCYLKAEI